MRLVLLYCILLAVALASEQASPVEGDCATDTNNVPALVEQWDWLYSDVCARSLLADQFRKNPW